jgi:hypothetical protein
MRRIPIIALFLLAGCQGLSPLDRWMAQPAPSIMPFWDTYQRCMTTTDADVLVQSVAQLENAMLEGLEPPDWMKTWGGHVARQPLRVAVDPRALSAACTIRTASVMNDQARHNEATVLYQRVLARYADREQAYYVERAKDAMAMRPPSEPAEPALLARR